MILAKSSGTSALPDLKLALKRMMLSSVKCAPHVFRDCANSDLSAAFSSRSKLRAFVLALSAPLTGSICFTGSDTSIGGNCLS